MKYIRTKDGAIYKCPKDNYILVGSKEIYIDFEMAKQEGYKIADSIEELCDEIVVKRPNKRPSIISPKVKGLEDFVKDYEVYGAIWIEGKGLIYVAKMNNDGVLELI